MVLRDDRAAVGRQQPDVQLVDTRVQAAVLVPVGGVWAFSGRDSPDVPAPTPGPDGHLAHTLTGTHTLAPGLGSAGNTRRPHALSLWGAQSDGGGRPVTRL